MVRKLCAFLGIALIAPLTFAGAAGASHSPGAFVVGTGLHSDPGTQFAVSAITGPSGANAAGHFLFRNPGQPWVVALVRCVVVMGNRAIVTGVVVGTNTVVVVEAVDNTNPSQSSNPDLLRFSFAGFIQPDNANPGCFVPVLSPVRVTQGDIVVHGHGSAA